MTEAVLDFASRIEGTELSRLIDNASVVLVALSGGADSSLLLYLMSEYLKKSGVRMAACHLNHMIRGDEAMRDEDFSARLAESFGVEFFSKRVDVPSLVGNGVGLEEAARRERYAYFDELASSLGERVLVATAHNADDNFETVLFNLVRGTGAAGLCGIPLVRDGRYIRPLLSYTSEEIRATAKEIGLSYVVDSTNLSTDYTRNKLRHLVIPHLKELNPSACRAVLRMSDSLRRDESYLSSCADAVMDGISGDVTLPRETLAQLDPAVLPRVLMKLHAHSTTDDTPSLESKHLHDIAQQLCEHSGDFELSVPGGFSFSCRGGKCSFARRESLKEAADSSVTVLLIGRAVRKNGYVVIAAEQKNDVFPTEYENIYNLSIHTSVKFDTIKDKLELRTRAPGDAYRFGGMTRRLKKLLSGIHMPSEQRERLPVICDGDGILWVPGFPVRDGSASESGTRTLHILCVEETRLESAGIVLDTLK